MSPAAIGLIFVSSFMHAGWNLMAKGQKSELVFFSRMLIVIASVGIVPMVISEIATHSIGAGAWFYLLGSGTCAGIYFYALGRAYGSSDFTIVYPVARALPVLLVGIGDLIWGRELPFIGWLGLFFVASGCVLSPLESFRELKLSRYLHNSIIWMIIAGAGTVGYTLMDKAACDFITPGAGSAARYGFVFFFIAGVVFIILTGLSNRGVFHDKSPGWKGPITGAVLNFGSYWLVLWAYQLSSQVSYVVAFRQLSIVIGVIVAFAIYKERGIAVRLTASILIATGLILVGIFGG